MKWALALALVALLIVGTFAAGVWLLQRSITFPVPPVPTRVPPLAPGSERLELSLGSERTEVWFLPALAGKGARPVVISTHGNGELIDAFQDSFDDLRRRGVHVLLVEYPGYGRSGGTPSQESIRKVMLDAYDLLAARDDVDEAWIIAHGRSLGGGAAAQLARERPLAALVLESTFTSVVALAARMGAPAFLIRDPFNTLAVVRDFTNPVLVLHGDRDQIVPIEHGRALARAAPAARLVELPCGHNDCLVPWKVVIEFLRGAGVPLAK